MRSQHDSRAALLWGTLQVYFFADEAPRRFAERKATSRLRLNSEFNFNFDALFMWSMNARNFGINWR